MEKVYTPVSPHEKAMQRALIQYRNPENYELVKEALLKNHREDLIGFDRHCLIPPRPMKTDTTPAAQIREIQSREARNRVSIQQRRIQEQPDSVQPVRSRQITEKAAEAARGKQEEENDEVTGKRNF